MPRIQIYTTAVCPFCVAAKNFMKSKGWTWEEVRVDTDPARRDEMLDRASGQRTVPQIFINDQHVGGYDDMIAAERDGSLAQIAGEASA